MLRKLKRVLTSTIVFIVLTLSLNSWLNWKNLPIPIVRNAEDAKFADGVTLQAAGPNRTIFGSTKSSGHHAFNITSDASELNITMPRGPSVCLSKDAMASSKITKEGTYPQQRRFLSIGISSITRPSKKNYLPEGIKRLLDNLRKEDMSDLYVVIFLADLDDSIKSIVLREISDQFKTHIDQGLLYVIYAPQEFYPPLSDLRTKFGDTQQRVAWRSKLVIDFAFIMCYCRGLSQYYLHLEDDLIPAPSFFPKLRDFIVSQKDKPWPILDAAFMGHTAKVYHSTDLENIASFFYLMYNEMPGDWLLELWRKIKYDRKDYKEFVLPPAALFQHIGDSSSFIENKNSFKSKEKFYDAYDVKYRGLNPLAIVTSSMSSNDGTKPEDAYNKGTGFFWAKRAKENDYIEIRFNSPVFVHEVFVETGSYTAPNDFLKSGSLQASFVNHDNELEATIPADCKNYESIKDFKNGKVNASLQETRKVLCFRILVTKDQSEWIFVREIDVL
ncbi:alpha-1,6-mannosyl-glycoprotein 4-beta-N-acetylglucosaminyltransferase-like isoform X2 [Montipora capricornis]|uniref:alpha-1,6-mannosyl-glycoprotein 4-beta-N-acetylglucosaminyltransferase-like isoform X2 n=1 Tax=Montipora capricornis TaxID=246305 RepID=UPI0035F1EF1C